MRYAIAGLCDFSAPNDFSALLDVLNRQLGLTLERRKEPVEVLVIDRVEQPTPD